MRLFFSRVKNVYLSKLSIYWFTTPYIHRSTKWAHPAGYFFPHSTWHGIHPPGVSSPAAFPRPSRWVFRQVVSCAIAHPIATPAMAHDTTGGGVVCHSGSFPVVMNDMSVVPAGTTLMSFEAPGGRIKRRDVAFNGLPPAQS